eukprot:CAMPEP_0171684426 /NCGR_PEP_ID=MMETSP0991-20121206/1678_1 /TAXON_ID=483369 /ORGANISM="non described non described, Strain CCMP2098" /LENGTH=63 /DNA_ID=CAMNT_0012271945 /DNA_START=111 /DNA_END=299 /DNA_ORIENTATION=+
MKNLPAATDEPPEFPTDEYDEVNAWKRDTVEDGLAYYLVDAKWWKRWKAFVVSNGLSGERPGA